MPATDATASAAASSSTASKSTKSTTKLAKDMDTFLTLLTTQLKYQDPLSPMDSTEFTNQLVQFSNVEQGIQSNANLEKLISLQNANSTATSVSYLDKIIEADGTKVPLQNGAAEFSYALTAEASNVTVALMDSSGSVVFSMVGETTPGKHSVQWDGTDPYGAKVPDGTYTINVTAMAGATGETVDTVSTVTGIVTGISTLDGVAKLSMSGVEADLTKVIAVKARPPKTTTAPVI